MTSGGRRVGWIRWHIRWVGRQYTHVNHKQNHNIQFTIQCIVRYIDWQKQWLVLPDSSWPGSNLSPADWSCVWMCATKLVSSAVRLIQSFTTFSCLTEWTLFHCLHLDIWVSVSTGLAAHTAYYPLIMFVTDNKWYNKTISVETGRIKLTFKCTVAFFIWSYYCIRLTNRTLQISYMIK